MVELFCYMCGHRWSNPKVDACPECGSDAFSIDEFMPDEWTDEDGHYEGDFSQSLLNGHGHGD